MQVEVAVAEQRLLDLQASIIQLRNEIKEVEIATENNNRCTDEVIKNKMAAAIEYMEEVCLDIERTHKAEVLLTKHYSEAANQLCLQTIEAAEESKWTEEIDHFDVSCFHDSDVKFAIREKDAFDQHRLIIEHILKEDERAYKLSLDYTVSQHKLKLQTLQANLDS